jgi:protein phosphatase
VNLDTGCAFGGSLSALRYPEREIVSVHAHATYYEPRRPFLPTDAGPARAAQHAHDDVLDLADVTGKRIVDTRLQPRITIREENAIAALEVMSRFAVDPKWLIYLPPTMSPSETSKHGSLLEHPQEAFSYYRSEGVPQVICEQKHMGSRAVVVLCRDESVSQRRFGVVAPALGSIYTRTGRRFFSDETMERAFLGRLREAVEKADLWSTLGTDWLCLDCELMPWSAKAQELLRQQYAPVGTAGLQTLLAEQHVIELARDRVSGLDKLADRTAERLRSLQQYVREYRHYCWPVNSLDDFKLAPFHLLASEGAVHVDKRHTWHMEMIAKLCEADERLLLATPFQLVDVNDPTSCDAAIA